MGLYRNLYVKNSNSGFCILYFNCRLTTVTFVTKVKRNGFLRNFRELKVCWTSCSLVMNVLLFLLLFSRLNMDRLSFVFSLLLIFSVTTATFGSVIKAKNPNGEVNKKDFFYCL